jgi:hypothetical protein
VLTSGGGRCGQHSGGDALLAWPCPTSALVFMRPALGSSAAGLHALEAVWQQWTAFAVEVKLLNNCFHLFPSTFEAMARKQQQQQEDAFRHRVSPLTVRAGHWKKS